MESTCKRTKVNPYGLTTPCEQCPFRNDIKPYLRSARIEEIGRDLERGEFHCHKTVEHDEEGEPSHSPGAMHCAGALIMMEKSETSSQMMRIAERLGMYDHTKLNMDAPVYESIEDMIEAAEKTSS